MIIGKAAALATAGILCLGCGPHDPWLPGTSAVSHPSSNATGGRLGQGGTSSQPGSGGYAMGAGGAGPYGYGGSQGAGGRVGAGGVGAGGGAGRGGLAGTAGTTSQGTGGSSASTAGELSVYTFGSGAEPCSPPKDVSGGQSGDLGLGAACLRTADDFTAWNCTDMDDRTVKINNVVTKCGASPPAKLGSFYYFDISSGATAWASFSWFCTEQSCGPHPIPSCGSYPAWVAGGTAAPCSSTGSGTLDGGNESADGAEEAPEAGELGADGV